MPKSKLYCAEQDATLVCAIDVLSFERDTQYKARLLCCVLILFRLYFNFSLKQSRSCDWVCYFIVCQVNWNRNRCVARFVFSWLLAFVAFRLQFIGGQHRIIASCSEIEGGKCFCFWAFFWQQLLHTCCDFTTIFSMHFIYRLK